MAALTDPAITIFAWGNESRGDDAIGAILARRIIELEYPGIDVVEDHQLHLEHVMDIRDDTPVLFIDASVALNKGFQLERLQPGKDESISSHSVSPTALLHLYEYTLGKSAPSAWLLHVSGSHFELGEDISASAATSLEQAWRFLDETFGCPADQWCARLESASSAS